MADAVLDIERGILDYELQKYQILLCIGFAMSFSFRLCKYDAGSRKGRKDLLV